MATTNLASRGRLYDPEIQAEPDIEQDDIPDDCRELPGYVNKGNWEAVERLISRYGNDVFSWVWNSSGWTILHYATMAGHVNIVDKLVRPNRESLVRKQDREGYTALALAAYYTGNKAVAKCMIENMGTDLCNELLTTPINKEGHTEIPLLLAADGGHKEMTLYLYDITPPTLLDGSNNPHNRVLLFERCIKAQIFDVAEKLLVQYPDLPEESLDQGFRALSDLAQMPSVFLSGCQFRSFGKDFYDCLKLLQP